MRITSEVSDLDVYIEQPCVTYEECLTVRKHTNRPFILDENVDDIHSLVKAHADHSADVVNLKISKLGGLTKMKQVLDNIGDYILNNLVMFHFWGLVFLSQKMLI